MRDLILRTAARLVLPPMVAFSLFLLWRGHNEPGGGFSGGLVVAAGLALYAIAFGVGEARRLLPVPPRALAGLGLLVSLVAGLVALVRGEPFLTGVWAKVPALGLELGTPFLFDVGVYLTVIGATLTVLWTLGEE